MNYTLCRLVHSTTAWIAIWLCIVFLWPSSLVAQINETTRHGDGYELDILSMDENQLIVEFRLRHYDLSGHKGTEHQTHALAVEGLTSAGESGHPPLPGLGRLVGLPPGGTVGITVLEVESEIISDIRLDPSPSLFASGWGITSLPIIERNVTPLNQIGWMPEEPVWLGETGKIRDQPFVSIQISPFQYNAQSHQLRIHHRLQFELRFSSRTTASAVESSSRHVDTAYAQLLRGALLNYEVLSPVSVPEPAKSIVKPANVSQEQAPQLKIGVNSEAIYKVTYADLVQAGFDTSNGKADHLRLINMGREVAIFVSSDQNKPFAADDWIEFYGEAPDNPFTKTNIYWLSIGDQRGKRIGQRTVDPRGNSAVITYRRSRRWEENHEYWPSLPDGEGQDHWFWERFPSAPHSSDYRFHLPDLADGPAAALMRLGMQGRSDVAIAPDHHVQVMLNGVAVDDVWWEGKARIDHATIVEQSLLRQGENVLTINAPGDTGAAIDSIYFDYFEVDYGASLSAVDDQITFQPDQVEGKTFSIENFTTVDIEIYDVGNDAEINRLIGGEIEQSGERYKILFADRGLPDSRYLVTDTGAKRGPVSLELDKPSALKSAANQADYVIIAYPDFIDAITPLADYRSTTGLSTVIVDVIDVYDEFSHGLFTPQAIRDFLAYAFHEWQRPAPLYVLLVGDANYDYQDYSEIGHHNFVPTHLFESRVIGQTPTDNWYVSVSGDDMLPDMFIGRIAARNIADVEATVEKILTYEQQKDPGQWAQTGIFVAEDEANFQVIGDRLIDALPQTVQPVRVYGDESPDYETVTSSLKETINQGSSIVTFIGHGSVTGWFWNERIFDNSNILELANAPNYPFLITGSCYNGLFAHPTEKVSFAELFVQADGRGGVAALSPTGLGYTYWHDTLLEMLFDELFERGTREVGAAATAAKIRTFAELGWQEPVQISTLFGDPALNLHIQQPSLSLPAPSPTPSQPAPPLPQSTPSPSQTPPPLTDPEPTPSEPATAPPQLTQPLPQPQLTLESRGAIPRVIPGQRLTYYVTIHNSGTATARDLNLTMDYDPHLIYATALPLPSDGLRRWSFSELASGASTTIMITLRATQRLDQSMLLSTKAVLSGRGVDAISATTTTLFDFKSLYFPLVAGR